MRHEVRAHSLRGTTRKGIPEEVSASRVVSTVPIAITTAPCPPFRAEASGTSTDAPFCHTRTPVTRTQLSPGFR